MVDCGTRSMSIAHFGLMLKRLCADVHGSQGPKGSVAQSGSRLYEKMMVEAHTIRAARDSEAELLSELALRSKAHWGYSPEFIEACRAELSYREEQLRSKHMRFVVLESAGIVIGFYALARQSGQVVELEALFVEPRF